MAKRKLTIEILEHIELCASYEYTLDEIREEANIIRSLMEDRQVQEAIERGRVKWFIEVVSTDGDIDTFIHCSGKTMKEIEEMFEVCKPLIELKKAEIKANEDEMEKKKVKSAKLRTTPSSISGANLFVQFGEESGKNIDQRTLVGEIELAAKKLQSGDSTALLEILMGNIMQLHHFNAQVTGNLVGDLGKNIKNFEKLSNMQLKLMQETRKSIMAINEICNPKRATFIKEANQHNHLHQNSQKKDENKNELSQPKEVIDADQYTEAETITEGTDQ